MRPLALIRILLLLLAPLSVTGARAAAGAPETPGAVSLAPSVPTVGDPRGVTRFAPTRSDAPPTLARRLHAVHDAHAEALAQLREQLANAPAAARPALQRRIEGEKLAYEARLVTLQLERARALGLRGDADRLGARLMGLQPRLARLGVSLEGGAR